jgi:prepilin-type N-terminal cleavage/methylation domain-containing protein
MSSTFSRHAGFTLIELMVALAVVAVLGAIAVVGYMKYTERAQGVDIVVRYDAIRTGVAARAQSAKSGDCAELAKGFDSANLAGSSARLAYGFEAVAGGYRPVLTVCAQAGTNGPQGVNTARGAYETLARNGVVEKNPVLTDSVVSFALRLTEGDQPLCALSQPAIRTACGDPVAVPTASAKTPATATVATPTPQAIAVPRLDPAALAAAVQALPVVQALPQAERQAVGDTAAQMAADPNYAKAVAEAIAQAPTGQPVGVPASAQVLTDFTARCPATKLGPPWPVADRILGTCPALYIANCNDCVAATVCPVSCGLTKGISPDVQKALDASWREARRRTCEAQYGAGSPRCAN